MSKPNRNSHSGLALPGRLCRAGWIAAAIGVLATAAASAQGPLKTVEECLESGTDLVTLPGVAGGSILARECRGCTSVRLEFDGRTRYFIGKEQVSYAQLREAAAREGLRLYVFYQPDTRTLTRLRLVAAAASQ
jgi:hypothetical protein